MKKVIFFIVILLIVSGCEDCSDDGEINNLLTDTEKELIPFATSKAVNFLNIDSEIVNGAYSEKVNEIRDLDFSNDEECFATNVESEISVLTIDAINFDIEISVGKGRDDSTFFELFIIGSTGVQYVLSECDGIVENLESLRQNIVVQGFEYTNVYEFSSCSQDSAVNRILYSSENGVEFIEFADDTYLRLDI